MGDEQERATLIASLPPVVHAILDYLPAVHLNKCAQVCTLWRDTVKVIKKRRRQISWFSYYYCYKETLPRGRRYPKGANIDCLASFLSHLNDLPSEPLMALVFCSKSMVHQSKYFFPLFRARKRKFDSINEEDAHSIDVPLHRVFGSLFPFFPRNCDVGFCTASGITKIPCDIISTREIKFCPSFSILYFPTLPGVKIYRFPLSGVQNAAPLVYSRHTGIPKSTKIKCLLVFLYCRVGSSDCLPYNKIIRHYLAKQNWKMALGGAYVDRVFFPKQDPRRRNQCYGIAFTGKNVEAASVVVTKDMDTKQQIAEQLKLVTDGDILQGHCIAFMFTCEECETNYYENNDFESTIFRKLFPHIPLFAVFGSGEVGINYIPNQKSTQRRKDCSWIESYATVFVIVSLRV